MLQQTIAHELQGALRKQDALRLSVFRLLSSALHNKEIEKRSRPSNGAVELSDDEVITVIRSELKKRKDAAAAYRSGGRRDSAAQEEAEGEILAAFLPEDLSDEAVLACIEEGMKALGATSTKDFGKLVGWVMVRVGGRSSGERIAQLIQEKLRRA